MKISGLPYSLIQKGLRRCMDRLHHRHQWKNEVAKLTTGRLQ